MSLCRILTNSKRRGTPRIPPGERMFVTFASFFGSFFACFFGIVFGGFPEAPGTHFGSNFYRFFGIFSYQKRNPIFNGFFIDFWMDLGLLNP